MTHSRLRWLGEAEARGASPDPSSLGAVSASVSVGAGFWTLVLVGVGGYLLWRAL